MEVLHLTPDGPGSGTTCPERRIARALVFETIRHELSERHAAHWPRFRPSARRRLGACLAARRRGLIVVTDHDGDGRRVLAAATYRSTSARLGRVATAPLRVLRWCTKGPVILATMLVLLALRDGRVGIGVLFMTAVVVAVVTAPAFRSARERLGDRLLAARAALLAPGPSGSRVTVVHQLGFPQHLEYDGLSIDSTELVAQALRARDGSRRVAQPCCEALATRYGRCRGIEWLPRHADVSRTALVILPVEAAAVQAASAAPSAVSSLAAYRKSLQPI